ncbi:MAG: hypothetical protein IJH88_07610 [Eggerthellaceae bacterium]|nr:hypothetical protein [Eggerthellaceae bacterium]
MAIHVNKGQEDPNITPLSDEELSSVSGGVVHLYHGTYKFEVIDDETGDVLGTFDYDDLEGAQKYAREIGVEDRLVYTSYVFDLRREYEAKKILEKMVDNGW